MIKDHPEDENVTLSQPNVTISCSVAGFPPPTTITWFHNGSQLQSIEIANEMVNNYTITSTAVIPVAGTNTTGSYFCRAASTVPGHESQESVDSNPAFVFVRGKLIITY